MRVYERTTALVIRPGFWCGKAVLVLHQERVDPDLGMLWCCRSSGQERVLAELSLRVLNLRGTDDPEARELLSETYQAAWDAWFSPPELDL